MGVIIAKMLDCGLEVSKFKLQWRYYIHFWRYTLGKGMNPFISPVMSWIVSLLFLIYKDGFGIK